MIKIKTRVKTGKAKHDKKQSQDKKSKAMTKNQSHDRKSWVT